jgi:hypothetical protein
MRVVFLLENNEYIDVEPTKLQLRQISPGQSALGVEVIVPQRNEDNSVKLAEDGSTLTQSAFRPIINYAVDLTVATDVSSAVEPGPRVPSKKSKRKAANK